MTSSPLLPALIGVPRVVVMCLQVPGLGVHLLCPCPPAALPSGAIHFITCSLHDCYYREVTNGNGAEETHRLAQRLRHHCGHDIAITSIINFISFITHLVPLPDAHQLASLCSSLHCLPCLSESSWVARFRSSLPLSAWSPLLKPSPHAKATD